MVIIDGYEITSCSEHDWACPECENQSRNERTVKQF